METPSAQEKLIKALERLENEVHTELVPGTEVMTNTTFSHFVKDPKTDEVLIPQPSADPRDPLNWSPIWKASAVFNAMLFTFVQAIGPLSLAPIFPELIQDFHSTLSSVVQFTGVCILVLGFSNFLWVPLSETYGRRPVMISSSLLATGAYAWRATAKSYESFLAASALVGIATGPGEALAPSIIADAVFLHKRGLYNTIYFGVFFSAVLVGPTIAGAMTETVGWRSFWWLNSALNAFVTVTALVSFPETRWPQRKQSQRISLVASMLPPSPLSDRDDSPSPKSSSTVAGKSESRNDAKYTDNIITGSGRPSLQHFYLAQNGTNTFKTIFLHFLLPLRLLFYPIVLFPALVTAFSSTNYLIINLTQSRVFSSPPYSFSALAVGLTNFSSLVGVWIGIFTAGPLSDWVSAKFTARNGGIREPEMRLAAMIPYVILMAFGAFITSFGFQEHWAWQVIVVIGFGLIGIVITALPSIATTYAIDCYKLAAGSILITVTITKNLWGYGASNWVINVAMRLGYVAPFMLNLWLAVLWCSCGIGFWVWGKQLRRWTAKSFVHEL